MTDQPTRIRPGDPTSFASRSPSQPFMVAFEDDGETGYFYALDPNHGAGKRISDAVQVYTARSDAEMEECVAQIVWSEDGCRSGFVLDGEIRAVFDFPQRLGCSLSGFPPANEDWKRLRGKSGEMVSFLAGKAADLERITELVRKAQR